VAIAMAREPHRGVLASRGGPLRADPTAAHPRCVPARCNPTHAPRGRATAVPPESPPPFETLARSDLARAKRWSGRTFRRLIARPDMPGHDRRPSSLAGGAGPPPTPPAKPPPTARAPAPRVLASTTGGAPAIVIL
jgi:hypothetical protein